MIRSLLMLGVVSGLVTVGCGAGVDSPGSGLIESRSAHMNADGTVSVTTVFITPETMQREVANKARLIELARQGVKIEEIANDDGNCAGSDMWLYSATNQGGTRCCISGSGYGTIPGSLCGSGYGVHSYWAGVSAGYFDKGTLCSSNFNAYDYVGTADACTTNAYHLELN